MTAVLAAQRWRTNGDLIADVARLGYLDGSVLDCTYGEGVFWRKFQPEVFVGCDIDEGRSPVGRSVDFRYLVDEFGLGSFDVVVFDPPYKLNGRPDPETDERYGVHRRQTVSERLGLIRDGMSEAMWVARKRVLVKVMDQVVSGKKVWQTDVVTAIAAAHGFRKIDRFDMLVTPRPQPSNRRQVHTQANYSTLLVFEKERGTP